MTHANRGMGFEAILDRTNEMYGRKGIAIINKRPTPIKVLSTKGNRVSGVYAAPSTVDYDGVYRGRPVMFEAKSVQKLTRFDLKNLHDHQYEYLKKCHHAGAISFLLIEFTSQKKTYLIPYMVLKPYWDEAQNIRGKKSINILDIDVYAYEVGSGAFPVHYLQAVDEVWFSEAI
ncbi:recombinase RecU [Paenibacillus macquariensis subsp. defensor]|nr:recombinase RecU [Paenibacillus macquariensis subsp. defensor]